MTIVAYFRKIIAVTQRSAQYQARLTSVGSGPVCNARKMLSYFHLTKLTSPQSFISSGAENLYKYTFVFLLEVLQLESVLKIG